MTKFREQVLARLDDQGVNEELIVKKLAQVIRGESTKDVYIIDEHGTPSLVRREVIARPKDVAAGAILYDALRGGELGLAPRVVSHSDSRVQLYDKWAPPVNPAIIAAGAVALPMTPSDALAGIASKVEDDDSGEKF